MTMPMRSLVVVAGLALGLAACGSSKSTTPTPTPVVPPKVEDQFGACFATRYRADPNTKATDPVPCPDLAPLSLTTKPAAI
jgi:hypothetical protein